MAQHAQALALAGVSFVYLATATSISASESGGSTAGTTTVPSQLEATGAPRDAPTPPDAGAPMVTRKFAVELGRDPGERSFTWRGELRAPAGIDLDPAAGAVVVTLTSGQHTCFEAVVPPHSFARKSETDFRYDGTLGLTSRVVVRLSAHGDGAWDFNITAARVPVLLWNHHAIGATLSIGEVTASDAMAVERQGDRLAFVPATPEAETATWVPEPAGAVASDEGPPPAEPTDMSARPAAPPPRSTSLPGDEPSPAAPPPT